MQARFKDKKFPKLSIQKYTSELLGIPENNVSSTLFKALPLEKQTDAHKALIEKALQYNVNASGAIVLMLNTTEGIKLVSAYSQRRKIVVSTNGTCESGESMEDAARREFIEELGNPEEKSILASVIKNPENFRSVMISNKIGESAADIAKKNNR